MPKRSCPFGDAAPLQLKTRVGLRELSRGVRGEEYRREVFEKTRRLLFRGAQAYMEGAAAAARPAEPGPAGEAQSEEPRWSGQLLIGHDGKLRRRPLDRATQVASCKDVKEYSDVYARSRSESGPGNVQWGADWRWHLRDHPGGDGKKGQYFMPKYTSQEPTRNSRTWVCTDSVNVPMD
ncbi:hypothetical protein DUI87_24891 [Hirundo rustica rustica]|uniref:Uncharacterized protein n=1 Tax=Hirundo rustica rustica TaxID=333673 RepID=A0A3M0JI38_HIRRU|nr:hypothetical protein DUI87_24891 [Hirundo rustica rustica]